MRENEINS